MSKNLHKAQQKKVLNPKDLGTDPLKFDARSWAKALAPDIALFEIKKEPFKGFLEKEGKGISPFLVKFWEISPTKKYSRAVIAGKEETAICDQIETTLAGLGRGTNWAGVTFTHPDLKVRTQLYRYPTASICPERIGFRNKKYQELKERFESFLMTQVPKKIPKTP